MMEDAILPQLSNISSLCVRNCSLHGECLRGICTCYVQYTGWSCDETNLHYYISFTSFFYFICIVSFLQLVLRLRSEHNTDMVQSSSGSVSGICKLDIQKLIYLFVICATGSRAVYFVLGMNKFVPPIAKNVLFFIFYPFILSVFSLIICFWAESFHLSGLQLDKPRFLTKSFHGFIVFNVIVYVMFIGQVVANNILHLSLAGKINEVFNGCIAFFMFSVLVFFLIYGVEIFCKIKGAFKKDETVTWKSINYDQLMQSRFGLIIEAAFQLALTMFLIYEVLGGLYHDKLSIFDRNIMKVLFHVVELGCVAWFPCCLWNVKKPGKLWILNPKNLLHHREKSEDVLEDDPFVYGTPSSYGTSEKDIEKDEDKLEANIVPPSTVVTSNSNLQEDEEGEDLVKDSVECWICLGNEDPQSMIQPCNCKGGMRLVHHACLKNWIMEKPQTNSLNEEYQCNVCKANYQVQRTSSILFVPTKSHLKIWGQMLLILLTMVAIGISLYFVWHRIQQKYIKATIFFILFIAEYIFLRMLGFNFVKAYSTVKRGALIILNAQEGTTG